MRPLRLVAFLLVFVGCQLSSPLPDGSQARTGTRTVEEPPSDVASSSTETLAPEPARLTVPDCPPSAFCALGFEIGGRFWSLGCLGVKPESISPNILAMGDTLVDEVRMIEGVAPEIMAAAHLIDSMGCGDEPPAAGLGWFAAFGPAHNTQNEATAMSLARAVCNHGINPLPGDRCDEGGGVQWVPGEGSEIRYAYFPEYQAQLEDELATGVGPRWRLDPDQVAIRHWVEEHNVCTGEFYLRCRAGIASIEIDGSQAAVDLLLQWGTPDGSQTLYETYPQHLTLVNSGEAWWVTAFEEGSAVVHGVADSGRVESDRWWEGCCRLIVVDREQGIDPPP